MQRDTIAASRERFVESRERVDGVLGSRGLDTVRDVLEQGDPRSRSRTRTCAVLLALSHDTQEQVDAIAKGAAAADGKTDVRERMDTGWLYNRAIEDPDGHILELVWMDVAALASAEAEHA